MVHPPGTRPAWVNTFIVGVIVLLSLAVMVGIPIKIERDHRAERRRREQDPWGNR